MSTKPCPNDTNGDGNCGRPACPRCGTPEAKARGDERRKLAAFPAMLEALRRANAIERSVTQGQERELRVGYPEMLTAALAAAEGTA